MRSLWYTGYLVSSLTWLVLAYVEWQVPGFVSQVFPLYLVMMAALGCGIAAVIVGQRSGSSRRTSEALALGVGILGSMLVLHGAEALGAFRLVLALVALLLPLLLLKALSDVKN